MTTPSPVTPTSAAATPTAAGAAVAGGRIVVGVDDGQPSRDALRWALRAARRLGWVVDVVTVWPDREAAFVHEVPGHSSDHRHRAVEAQRSALADSVGAPGPQPRVRTFVENARPVDALVAHGRGAALLVVGAPRQPSGSTPALLSRRADCPVVVVDAASRPVDEPVVGLACAEVEGPGA